MGKFGLHSQKMSQLRLIAFEAFEMDDIEMAKDMPEGNPAFLNIPLVGTFGDCLDYIPVPVDLEFLAHAFLTPTVESPYGVRLWARKYEDGRVVFDLIDEEDIPRRTEQAQGDMQPT